MMTSEKKPKAVVVGGSIAGLCTAHMLTAAGWEVVLLETSFGPTIGSTTGADLGLDPLSCSIIQSWLRQLDAFHKATFPLTIDQNQVTDGETKISWTLTKDENFNFRAAHWGDPPTLLHAAPPPYIFLWGVIYSSHFRLPMTNLQLP
ncbi:hypothetical protein Ancab_002377 [Ancistrocladus abbreviatus]